MVSDFRFDPVIENGRPVVARARMRLSLVAAEQADKSLRVSIENVTFPDPEGDAAQAAPTDRVWMTVTLVR